MSSYPYSSLLPKGDNIRLLCLSPNEDEAAPLQCELRNYSLQKLGPRAHLYEALSYAWGNPHETLLIRVGGVQFPVTINLYAALSHLRDHSFERIIWVDAICINQDEPEEQGQQVQLMAKIYSNAHRVIVWLGKKTEDTEGALEYIRLAANGESMDQSKKETILNLLQRPWFQRIWVLQEVAAARHIVMMCGSMEIDGYVFCLGLTSLKLPYATSPELQSLPSLSDLIERAGFRSKYTTNSSEKFSLKICRLAELIDMFHIREASDVRDKVYALLGMSSDDPGAAGLRPDYKLSWKELFQQLIKFVLSKDVSVETDDSQRALIKSKGCILGQVSSVKTYDRQIVNITSKNAAWYSGDKEWTLQASAKSIQERDIVCLLQGASKPTIIRLYKDDFAVIVIAATPLNKSWSLGRTELPESIAHFPRDFPLVWDWEIPLEESRDREEYENFIRIDDWVPLYKATRIWDVALILGDLEEYEKAKEKLQEAVEGYERVFKKEHLRLLKGQYSLTPLSWASGNGYDTVVKLLLAKDGVDPDLKDRQYSRTPLSWAAEGGHTTVVKLLLETGQAKVDSKAKDGLTPLWMAANQGHEAVVKLLLQTGQVEVDIKDNNSQTPLWMATWKGHKAVVKLLLETGQVEVDSKNEDGQTPLWIAAEQGHEAMVKLLLETGQVEVDIKGNNSQTPLWMATWKGHKAVVKLLLETGQVEVDIKDKDSRTPLWMATWKGHKAVVKLLLGTGQVEVDSKNEDGRTPLWIAARQGHEAVVKLLLGTGQVEVDSKNEDGQTPLWIAAKQGHEAVVKLLLETGQVEVDSKNEDGQTPLWIAAKQGHEAVAKLLQASIK